MEVVVPSDDVLSVDEQSATSKVIGHDRIGSDSSSSPIIEDLASEIATDLSHQQPSTTPESKTQKKKKPKLSSKSKREKMEELGALSEQEVFKKGDDREAARLVRLFSSGGGAKKLFLELPKAFEIAAENNVDVPMFALRLLHRVWRPPLKKGFIPVLIPNIIKDKSMLRQAINDNHQRFVEHHFLFCDGEKDEDLGVWEADLDPRILENLLRAYGMEDRLDNLQKKESYIKRLISRGRPKVGDRKTYVLSVRNIKAAAKYIVAYPELYDCFSTTWKSLIADPLFRCQAFDVLIEFVERSHRKEFQISLLNMIMSRLSGDPKLEGMGGVEGGEEEEVEETEISEKPKKKKMDNLAELAEKVADKFKFREEEIPESLMTIMKEKAIRWMVVANKVNCIDDIVENDKYLASYSLACILRALSTKSFSAKKASAPNETEMRELAARYCVNHDLDPAVVRAQFVSLLEKTSMRTFSKSSSESDEEMRQLELLQRRISDFKLNPPKRDEAKQAHDVVIKEDLSQDKFFRLGRPVLLSYNKLSVNNGEVEPLEVVFITNIEGLSVLEDMITEIEGNSDIVLCGLDSEWRPQFVKYKLFRSSILQIAFSNRVFILDLIQMNATLDSEEDNDSEYFNDVIEFLFNSNKILKIGYGFRNDLSQLALSYPKARCFNSISNFIDLQSLYRAHHVAKAVNESSNETVSEASMVPSQQDDSSSKEVDDLMDQIPSETETNSSAVNEKRVPGLSDLVKEFLGKPLDKSCQCSNWERRPLDINQVLYATTDSHCQIKLFEVMASVLVDETQQSNDGLASGVKLLIENIVLDSTKESAKKKKRKTRKVKKSKLRTEEDLLTADMLANRTPRITENYQPQKGVIARDLRVIVDNMLWRLCRHLRILGVDAVFMERKDWEGMAKLSKEESRVIITRDVAFYVNYSKILLCYYLQTTLCTEQLAEMVSVFGIKIDQRSLFSRCPKCNEHTSRWQTLTKKDVKDKISDIAYNKFELFWGCTGCGQIYWEGAQFDSGMNRFSKYINEGTQVAVENENEKPNLVDTVWSALRLQEQEKSQNKEDDL
eukprot:TRINITY_DN10641_c0_g4_i1.p1 TRINITY_DN10641_c0_g4~~TRINITY_DN10641_c0_g4_i1.p1  ORF type:complete len:1078 (-),score=186.54 TRINITY_DN10641_c0_g4_i1:56-3247(-)